MADEPRADPSPLRIVVPASRYPVTIHVVGQVQGVEFDGVDEYCPPDLPQVRVYLDIVKRSKPVSAGVSPETPALKAVGKDTTP